MTEQLDTQALISLIGNLRESIQIAKDEMERAEFELTTRMERDGATAVPHPEFDVRMESKPTYDHGKLAMLREFVPPDELTRGYTQEHEQTVTIAAKWDMRIVKSWSKYGNEVKDAIKSAAIPGAPKLRIRKKESKP
jgi:hypothetical protein